jgi:hypothetical protein
MCTIYIGGCQELSCVTCVTMICEIQGKESNKPEAHFQKKKSDLIFARDPISGWSWQLLRGLRRRAGFRVRTTCTPCAHMMINVRLCSDPRSQSELVEIGNAGAWHRLEPVRHACRSCNRTVTPPPGLVEKVRGEKLETES